MNSKPDLKLDFISYKSARVAVERWHYSRRMPSGKIVKIGVWESGAFIGCVLFGSGATRALVKQYDLKPWEGCELVRVALGQHVTEVSRIVAIALRLLRRACPKLRLVVSFADPEQSHVGGIYQAGNWIYTGRSHAADEYIVAGVRMHGRSFRCKYKGREHDPSVTVIKGSSKHRYLMPLDDALGTKLRLLQLPYPKRVKKATSATSASAAVRPRPTRSISRLQASASAQTTQTITRRARTRQSER